MVKHFPIHESGGKFYLRSEWSSGQTVPLDENSKLASTGFSSLKDLVQKLSTKGPLAREAIKRLGSQLQRPVHIHGVIEPAGERAASETPAGSEFVTPLASGAPSKDPSPVLERRGTPSSGRSTPQQSERRGTPTGGSGRNTPQRSRPDPEPAGDAGEMSRSASPTPPAGVRRRSSSPTSSAAGTRARPPSDLLDDDTGDIMPLRPRNISQPPPVRRRKSREEIVRQELLAEQALRESPRSGSASPRNASPAPAARPAIGHDYRYPEEMGGLRSSPECFFTPAGTPRTGQSPVPGAKPLRSASGGTEKQFVPPRQNSGDAVSTGTGMAGSQGAYELATADDEPVTGSPPGQDLPSYARLDSGSSTSSQPTAYHRLDSGPEAARATPPAPAPAEYAHLDRQHQALPSLPDYNVLQRSTPVTSADYELPDADGQQRMAQLYDVQDLQEEEHEPVYVVRAPGGGGDHEIRRPRPQSQELYAPITSTDERDVQRPLILN